jgi:tyrosinase
MQEIVNEIQSPNERQIWSMEASHWRLPYWDWAAKQPYIQALGMPQILTQEEIRITMPEFKQTPVKNPLWMFRNPTGKPMGDPSSMGKYAITDNFVSAHKFSMTAN